MEQPLLKNGELDVSLQQEQNTLRESENEEIIKVDTHNFKTLIEKAEYEKMQEEKHKKEKKKKKINRNIILRFFKYTASEKLLSTLALVTMLLSIAI